MNDIVADFETFYRTNAPAVLRFALFLTGERSDAEDIVSETFVRVWASSSPIKETTASAYLMTIAKNVFLKSLRSQQRNVSIDETLRDTTPDPYSRASTRSELDAVHARIMRLPDMDRTAFLMRVIDGTPYEEIARTLTITVASAKVKIHRARLTLADIRQEPQS